MQAEAIAANERITLPDDFLEAAAGEGLRKSILEAYIKLQVWLCLLLFLVYAHLALKFIYWRPLWHGLAWATHSPT